MSDVKNTGGAQEKMEKLNLSSDVKEYKIDVPQEKLDRLKRKLDDYVWPEELDNAGWDYGSPKYIIGDKEQKRRAHINDYQGRYQTLLRPLEEQF